MDGRDRFRGCLLGLACGDAVGTTVEFRSRGSFPPVTDMTGGGPFGLKPGEWTDDTSMALCLASSLLESSGFDAQDQMRRYCRWWREGYWSSTGTCFDIGTTTAGALRQFEATGEPFSGSAHPRSAGNGCLMRLAPVPMYFVRDPERAVRMSAESSRTTHGADECLECSRLFGALLQRALSGASRESLLTEDGCRDLTSPRVKAIAAGEFLSRNESAIRGSGYVVDCLEAALWCFHRTDTFEDAVLTAVNLGDDADTTGAVVGQIAGAFYGASAIPARWLDRLAMQAEIRQLADELYARAHSTPV